MEVIHQETGTVGTLQSVQALLNHNARAFVGERNPKRVAGAIEGLRKKTEKEVSF